MKKKIKVIVIIGGSGLIGNALVKNLQKDNHKIIILDKKLSPINQREKIEFLKTDILKISIFEKNIQKILKKFNRIDDVINCVYIKDNSWGKKFEKLKVSNLKNNLFYQLGIPIFLSKLILKIFAKQKFGNLVLFSSILGVRAPKFDQYVGTKMTAPVEYVTSKAGIIKLTEYLAKAYGKQGIRVNCISPGGIEENQPKSFRNKYKKNSLNKGLLKADDIAGAVKFIISEESKYINGQNIIVDDGWTL